MYEWDEKKHTENLRTRALGFDVAEAVFSGVHLTQEDNRKDYGEKRFITVGHYKGRMVVIAHTPRGTNTRIMSVRKANEREQKNYEGRLEAARRDEG